MDTGSGNDIPVKMVQQLGENLKAIPASTYLKALEVLFTVGQGQNHEVSAFCEQAAGSPAVSIRDARDEVEPIAWRHSLLTPHRLLLNPCGLHMVHVLCPDSSWITH